jgi:RNA polymerase sigma-54 factor
MDATPDDVSPGERATGDGRTGAEQAGGQIDWSRAGGGGSFEQRRRL